MELAHQFFNRYAGAMVVSDRLITMLENERCIFPDASGLAGKFCPHCRFDSGPLMVGIVAHKAFNMSTRDGDGHGDDAADKIIIRRLGNQSHASPSRFAGGTGRVDLGSTGFAGGEAVLAITFVAGKMRGAGSAASNNPRWRIRSSV